MIIDYSYFIRKLNLPQKGDSVGRTEIEQFIEQYEPEFILKALGPDLGQVFLDETEGSGAIDQRWTDLIEGKSYTYEGRAYKWTGFKNSAKNSPIANYVYWKFQENNYTTTTGSGEVRPLTDNNTAVAPTYKMVDAWNDMVDMNDHLWFYLYANQADYPEWQESINPGITGWLSPFNAIRNEVFHKINTFGI